MSTPSDGCNFIQTAQPLTIMPIEDLSSGTTEFDLMFSGWRKMWLVKQADKFRLGLDAWLPVGHHLLGFHSFSVASKYPVSPSPRWECKKLTGKH